MKKEEKVKQLQREKEGKLKELENLKVVYEQIQNGEYIEEENSQETHREDGLGLQDA